MQVPDQSRTPDERERALRSSELFRELDQASLRRMDAALEWLSVEADAVLFNQGESGDALFVVIEGRIDISRRGDDGVDVHVARLGPGQPIGELALLGDRPRSASARAARDSVVVRLKRKDFEELALNDPRITLALSRFLVDRALAGTVARPRAAVFAIVAVSEDAPIAEFAERLVDELSAWKPAKLVDAAVVDAAIAPGAAHARAGEDTHARVARWLQAVEADTASLVLVAERTETAWTTRCIRQADVVLLVARAGSRPRKALPAQMKTKQDAFDRRELILVHADGTAVPTDAARWSGLLAFDAWHHVRLGEREDIRRVARFLTGRAVALALSGGAARGFAHIGVLRALREAGIPIDLVCGTSMGSWIGAMAALNWGDERIAEEIRKYMVKRAPLDYQVPIVAMTSGRRFDWCLGELFGEGGVEDTWRRYFAISCSLTSAASVIHRTGSLARAVRASCATPGLFPPVVHHGEVLVDGMLLDNLPAEEAARDAGGRTIAVNVLPPVVGAWATFTEHGVLRHAARMLSRKVEDRMPPIMKIMMQAMFLSANNASARIRRQVDLFIEPAVGKIWFLDFGACDEIIELGYEAAKPAIDDWLARDPTILGG